jgi:hypothetical protein
MAAAALKSRLVCLLAVTVIAALLVGPADRPRDVAVSATGRSAAAGGAPVAYAGDPVRARTSSRIAANARVAMVYTGTTIRLVGSVVTRPRRGRPSPVRWRSWRR